MPVLELMRKPDQNEIIGSTIMTFEHGLMDITVPVTQTIEWNLHYVK